MPRPRTPRHLLPARLPAALTALDERLSDAAVRLVATSVAGLVLLCAGAAAGASSAAAPGSRTVAGRSAGVSREVRPQPIVLAALPEAQRPAAHPLAGAVPHPTAPHAAAQRGRTAQPWLPTGTGMWLHEFNRSENGDAAAVVAKAQAAGLSTLYVQTGSSGKGWIGSQPLTALLRATKGTGIRVVAWDFPSLRQPELDARRLATAAHFTCQGCDRVAAVAPDVETASEGTQLNGPSVQRYYRTLRHRIGPSIAILATVPWPSENRTGHYPYRQTAALSDAIMPMAYWYNRDPGLVTQTSMRYLARFNRPVMPVGQGYDGRLDAPYLAPDPRPGISVMAFLRSARAGGAQAVSLWSWQTAGPQQWHTLGLGRTLFPAARDVGGRT